MSSAADLNVLGRVGPGTPLGSLLRRYWIPLVFDWEIPEPDCDPVSVRVLGEDLVVFRDTDGRVGVLEAWCPHRLAHLFWGRNENNGLRCVHHGWKFDVTGQCVEMPSEPETSNFREKIQAQSYPAEELGNIVWIYMGPPESAPPPPQFEYVTVPEDHRAATKVIEDASWLNCIEGGFDEAKVSFLHHNDLSDNGTLRRRNTAPQIEAETTACGFTYLAARPISPEEGTYARFVHYVMPFTQIRPSFINAQGLPPAKPQNSGHFWVPIDDGQTMDWEFTYTWGEEPLAASEREFRGLANAFNADVDKQSFRAKLNRSNRYQIDRSMQRTKSFTGITGSVPQDRMIHEATAPIRERGREHLGSLDGAVVALRDLLLKGVSTVKAGGAPPGTGTEYHGIRAWEAMVHVDQSLAALKKQVHKQW